MRLSPSVLVLMFAVTACGSSPPTHFYTLRSEPSGTSATYPSRRAPIEVGHVDLPGTLDRQSMVTGGAGSRVNVSDQNRWSAPLDELVRRAVTGDLRQRLPEGQVLAPGDQMPKDGRTLTLNVQQFMADASGQVALEADWSLQSSDRRTPARHESLHVPVNGEGGQAVADAMSRALGQLADRIAAELS